jgi:uncharacterized membrane protein
MLDEGWRTVKAFPIVVTATLIRFPLAFALSFVLFDVLDVFGGMGTIERRLGPGSDVVIPINVPQIIVDILFGTYLSVGHRTLILHAARGQNPSLGTLFSGNAFWRVLPAGLIFGMVTVLGASCCIVPGIWLACGFFLYDWLLFDRRAGLVGAFEHSWRLTAGHRMRIFTYYFFFLALNLVGAAFCGVGIFLTFPITVAAQAHIYCRLTGTTTSIEHVFA